MLVKASGELLLRKPITGAAGCCACAAIGHVTVAPPRSVMNSRRLFNHLYQHEQRKRDG
jgi:hypothetical protein